MEDLALSIKGLFILITHIQVIIALYYGIKLLKKKGNI
jgi:hypothetical protein